jgi:hypothetical protein
MLRATLTIGFAVTCLAVACSLNPQPLPPDQPSDASTTGRVDGSPSGISSAGNGSGDGGGGSASDSGNAQQSPSPNADSGPANDVTGEGGSDGAPGEGGAEAGDATLGTDGSEVDGTGDVE